MAIYGTNVLVCATCNYWGGNRQAANMGNNAEVNNYENGVCNEPSRRTTRAKENGSCHLWRKWGALR